MTQELETQLDINMMICIELFANIIAANDFLSCLQWISTSNDQLKQFKSHETHAWPIVEECEAETKVSQLHQFSCGQSKLRGVENYTTCKVFEVTL